MVGGPPFGAHDADPLGRQTWILADEPTRRQLGAVPAAIAQRVRESEVIPVGLNQTNPRKTETFPPSRVQQSVRGG